MSLHIFAVFFFIFTSYGAPRLTVFCFSEHSIYHTLKNFIFVSGYTSRFEASYASECQTDGTWSSTHYISCTPLDCGNPPFLPNTYRQATPFSSNLQDTTAQIGGTTAPLSTTFESVMYYSCHAGYSFGLSDSFAIGTHNPRLALICGVNGTWDFAPGSISNINMSAGCVQLQVQ